MIAAVLLMSLQSIGATAAPPRIAVATLRDDCVAGANGDGAAGIRCETAMLAFAAPFSEASTGSSTCLAEAVGPAEELAWNWLAWLDDHPAPDEADAGASVAASMLDRWPCGWREG